MLRGSVPPTARGSSNRLNVGAEERGMNEKNHVNRGIILLMAASVVADLHQQHFIPVKKRKKIA